MMVHPILPQDRVQEETHVVQQTIDVVKMKETATMTNNVLRDIDVGIIIVKRKVDKNGTHLIIVVTKVCHILFSH